MEMNALPVACIGAGPIGQGWILTFARAGCAVRVYDSDAANAEQALIRIAKSAADLEQAGLVESADALVANVRLCSTMEAAVEGVSYVQESVREEVQVKKDVFLALDALAPAGAVIGSSTSEIAGSRFLESVPGRSRCLVAHPVNPPYLVPLVELCPAPWTSQESVERARQIMEAVGQAPIIVRKEVSGFILNRLQFALMGEALHLVGEGFCSAEDLDKTIKHGLGRRWAFMGPMETAHLNSIDGFGGYFRKYDHIIRKMIDDLQPAYRYDTQLLDRVHEELSAVTPVAEVPRRQVWRDRMLMRIARSVSHPEAAQEDRS